MATTRTVTVQGGGNWSVLHEGSDDITIVSVVPDGGAQLRWSGAVGQGDAFIPTDGMETSVPIQCFGDIKLKGTAWGGSDSTTLTLYIDD